ncbi:unnamed protein product [Acanthosepion pharaonis]|uniref:Uncharacterized protein n=1 Tax=Acanthosepion pharaonis TaxID=158019 RepID=A0A812E6L8_ACAPH|nr:unnamed protein product [Sepia pharaonis]
MAQLKYTPPRQSSPTIHVPQQLQDCEFIFVRNDAVKKPLTPTYQGPFKVLKRSEKHLTIDRGKGRTPSPSTESNQLFWKNPHGRQNPSQHTQNPHLPQQPRNRSRQNRGRSQSQNHPSLHLGRPSSRSSPAADGTQQQLFKQFSSGLTSQSHSITTLRDFTLRYCLPSVTPALLQPSDHSCCFKLSPAAFRSLLQLPALSCSLQLIPAPSSTPAAFRSLLQHPALLQLPARSCSLQLTLTASSTPTASSSLLQFTAHPYGALLTSRVLFQCPLTSSTRYRPDTVQTTSVFFYHPPFANKDTISIVYNGSSAFVILLCYCHLLALVSPF